MTYTTTMTSKGQITVPVAFRKQLGMQSGKPLKVELEGDRVILQADNWQANLAKLQARLATHQCRHNIKPLTDEELDQAINEAAQQAAIERYERSMKA